MPTDRLTATAIDIGALVIYVGLLTLLPDPPLGISRRLMMLIGLVAPFVAYVWTYREYPDQFWFAFGASLVSVTVLVVAGLWLFLHGLI